MKGFIELTVFDKPMLIATSAIVAVVDVREGECRVHLNSSISILSIVMSVQDYLPIARPYTEVVALIEQAQ